MAMAIPSVFCAVRHICAPCSIGGSASSCASTNGAPVDHPIHCHLRLTLCHLQENIDYSLPLNGTGLVPIGYNGSAWQALETMECDGQPILESSAGSGGMGALEYVAIILPTAVVVAVGAVVYVVLSRRQKRQWGIKLSELRFFDPEVVVGVGAFSRVALAKYRRVATDRA